MTTPEFLREFEFLPNLPKSNLDDRTFNDLVQECKLRIPRYCQEWTNHNPSDPGITLIELFAWLVDQMLLRFNQVPRLHYVAFLELLGIRLRPPTAAEAELTFYLTKPVIAGQGRPVRVAKGTEVATVRTETEPAVVFTTYQDLIIGQPTLRGLFTAQEAASGIPTTDELRNPVVGELEGETLGAVRVFQTSEPENCFYLVLAPASDAPDRASGEIAAMTTSSNGTQASNPNGDRNSSSQNRDRTPGRNRLRGAVIALNVRGVVAGSTGIDPTDPPLVWEVWQGDRWQTGILLRPQDDKTRGFSFHELQAQGGSPGTEGADIILHLPQDCPEVEFVSGYRGHWVRCTYRRKPGEQGERQGGYSYSPIINRLGVRAIGGAVNARECVTVEHEFLGISNGKPGQTFQLEGFPILERDPEQEYLVIKPPDEAIDLETDVEVNGLLGQRWQEVEDFSDSDVDELDEDEDEKRHYTLDSRTGTVQFGPLVLEPANLKYQTLERTRLQPWGKEIQKFSTRMESSEMALIAADDSGDVQRREWQYGKIPPRGAEIYMSAYRMGGGSRGNVQAQTLTMLKTAIPYVKSVTNHRAARGGTDAESLDEAVLRVPRVLRTAKSAMISEDFETVAKDAHTAIYRAHCLPCTTPGIVQLLVVPNSTGWKTPADIDVRTAFPHGMHPDQTFVLEQPIRDRLLQELDERKPLGVQVELEPPRYVGVRVFAEVLLHPKYQSETLQTEIRSRMLASLYRFLNPITGGFDYKGWELGRALSISDIVALLQDLSEVQLVNQVQLFSIRYHPRQARWFLQERPDSIVEPGSQGLICSWDEQALNPHESAFASAHAIRFTR